MTEPIYEVIITADSDDWLISFTRSLLEERLVACGQHIAPIRSIYRWDGTIHDDREMRVALHTRAGLVQEVIDRTRQAHPTRCPASSLFPLSGNPDYIRWVINETSEPDGDHAPDDPLMLARTC